MNLKIERGMWLDKEHTFAMLSVRNLDTDEAFDYGSNATDTAPMNIKLWEMVQEGAAVLEEPPEVPAPMGTAAEGAAGDDLVVIGESVINKKQALWDAEWLLNVALQPYTTPLAMARAAVDEAFHRERDNVFRRVVAVTNQRGYPHDIDWTDAAGLIEPDKLAYFNNLQKDTPDRQWKMTPEIMALADSWRSQPA